MYAAASQSIRQDGGSFSRRFLKSYGQNLKTSIPLWLIFLGVIFLLLLLFAASYLLLLWQPMLVLIVPGAANVVISKLVDPILDQHMPKKEGLSI